MRKLLRGVLRHQSDLQHGGVEGFRYLWIKLRKSQGKPYGRRPGRSHDLIIRRKKKSKAKITRTGRKMEKKSLWKRFTGWLKKLFRKERNV